MFSDEEGRLLVVYSAFSQKKKGTIYKISWHFLFTRLVFYLSQRTFFSLTEEHRWTEHTAFHRDIKSTDNTEPYSQQKPHPHPSPNGEGSDYRDTPTCPPHDSYVFSSYQQPNRGNLTYYSPLHSERGWGWGLCVLCMPKAFCEFETVRYYVLLDLWVLWEINLPSKSHRHYLIEWVRSISHRITQNNRTHSISQRH